MDINSDQDNLSIQVRVKTMDSTEIKVSTKPKDTVKMLKDEIYKVSLLKLVNFDNIIFKI
jgi:hypothetical protein